jgi:hypothetical protein
LSGTPELVAAKVRDFAEQGATELVYHVSGTDVHRELATFAEASTKRPWGVNTPRSSQMQIDRPAATPHQ